MKYYAMIDGERKGPFELEELPAAGVRPSTYIWAKGMDDWEKAEDVADVCRFYRNRLYDLMHPSSPQPSAEQDSNVGGSRINLSKDDDRRENIIQNPFQRNQNAIPQLPTVDEIAERENTSIPPMSMIGYAWIVTFLCFPPTGVAAIVYAYRAKKAWKAGEDKPAHDYTRQAKMWVGISFFMGLLAYAFIIRFCF